MTQSLKKSAETGHSARESLTGLRHLRTVPTLSELTGLLPPPREFHGSLEDFFEKHIEPNLPAPEQVELLHRFLIEKSSLIQGMREGMALWFYARAFLGDGSTRLEELRPKAKNQPGETWEKSFLAMSLRLSPLIEPGNSKATRALRLFHPANQLPIPESYLTEGVPQDILEIPGTKAFFLERYRERYSTIWDEFYKLSRGDQIHFHHAEEIRISIKRSHVPTTPEPVSLSLVKKPQL